MALNAIPELFYRNKREFSVLRSDNFKDITYVGVGAASVGTIVQTYRPGVVVARGDEKAISIMGGLQLYCFWRRAPR